ncbi:hypothetical protein ACXET9_15825 [Brachybacterium sp. DNPG3]
MQIPGIIHRSQLAQTLAERPELEGELGRALRSGAMRRVPPWYIAEGAPADVVAVLRQGMRPTCADGAALHGLFVPPVEGVHAFRPRVLVLPPEKRGVRLDRIRRRDGKVQRLGGAQPIVLHSPQLRAWPGADPVPDLSLVLEHAGRCLPTVTAAVILESAVHRGQLSLSAAQRIVAGLPHDPRRALSRIRADAESGTETAVRWWFESLGVAVRAQVPFPGGVRRRMDLLVGKSWVIECDSRAHHDDPRSYAEDRERDLYLRSRGFHVTRLTWEQVFLRWSTTEDLLRTILRRGEHRRAPKA